MLKTDVILKYDHKQNPRSRLRTNLTFTKLWTKKLSLVEIATVLGWWSWQFSAQKHLLSQVMYHSLGVIRPPNSFFFLFFFQENSRSFSQLVFCCYVNIGKMSNILRTFEPQILDILRTSSLSWKLVVLIKKVYCLSINERPNHQTTKRMNE